MTKSQIQSGFQSTGYREYMWCVGCFSRFLNCTNGTKSRNASHTKGNISLTWNIKKKKRLCLRLYHTSMIKLSKTPWVKKKRKAWEKLKWKIGIFKLKSNMDKLWLLRRQVFLIYSRNYKIFNESDFWCSLKKASLTFWQTTQISTTRFGR